MWLNDFKKALILQDLNTLEILIDQMPQMDSLSEMEEAAYLLHHAKTLLEAEQKSTLHSIQQLKKSMDFLNATTNSSSPTINIKL